MKTLLATILLLGSINLFAQEAKPPESLAAEPQSETSKVGLIDANCPLKSNIPRQAVDKKDDKKQKAKSSSEVQAE